MAHTTAEIDLYFAVDELQSKLRTATKHLCEVDRVPHSFTLSLAELFATRRAATLPAKVHAMWAALNDLEPQRIMTPAGYPFAAGTEVIFPLSDKCHEAVKRHGRFSTEHNAEIDALLHAMFDGMTSEEYTHVRIQKRRDAANIEY